LGICQIQLWQVSIVSMKRVPVWNFNFALLGFELLIQIILVREVKRHEFSARIYEEAPLMHPLPFN